MLVALWDVSNQFNDNNGSILTNGKIYVYYSGRAALAPTWSSADGSHVNPNPIILDNNGRAVAFADDQYTYTCVVCDFYGRELFSFDPASFGNGGGGSTTEGNDAAHWIGASGTDVQVTALTDTLLPLPASPDYEGDFVSQTTYTTISLNKGLYMVDADIRIQQDDDDLENIIKDISVYTGLTGPESLTTSQKNWTGPEASDDRHFVHVHFIRHVGDEGEDIYFQMNSPVDLSSAWIDKLSIVKLTEGGNGKNYVGGYGIDITGPVISVSGMIPEASAANFVDVSTYNTDIENIYETIAETSAMIPSGVATEQYVQDFTSAFITEDALDGYATEQWVEDQNYITSADIPPIPQDVVTSGELATVSGDIVSQIPSLDGYATEQWVGEQGYLTEIPSEYVTSGELASTSAAIESMIPSLDGYATEQFVEDYTSAFITSADVPHFTQEQADWNEDDPTAPDYIKNKPSIPSIEGLASEQYVQDYTSAFITSADIPDVPADVVTSGQLATVSGEIVNQIPDTSDMATKTWVGEQGYLTSIPDEYATSGDLVTLSAAIENDIPDTSDMATKTWVGQQGYLTSIPAEYATSGDLVTLSGALEAEIPSYTAGDNISIINDEISVSGTTGLVAGSNITITASGDNYVISSIGGEVPADLVTSGQLATVSGNIMNEMPDVSDMATQTWVGQQGYLTSVPDEYATSGDLATVSGRLSTVSTRYQSYFYPIETNYQRLRFNYGAVIPTSAANAQRLVEVGNGPTYTTLGELVPVPSTSGLVLTSLNGNMMSWQKASGGLDQVYHDAGLTGDGTPESPLSITSADIWNDAAGMNEYPISAGPGMSIEDVDGVTVFQTSGTMMDDLIEYNSQDEISGYNGHPVMTVDSEKQWLTHDDTIAHVTNSAQYAFGVNVPVVAQAMGTDETVLFETSAVNGAGICPLSESLKNFEQIKVLATRGYNGSSNPDGNGGTGPWSFWDTDGIISDGVDYHSVTPYIFEGYNWKNSCYSANNEYNLLTWYRGCQKNMASAAAGTVASSFTDCVGIKKIVGIGRKEN